MASTLTASDARAEQKASVENIIKTSRGGKKEKLTQTFSIVEDSYAESSQGEEKTLLSFSVKGKKPLACIRKKNDGYFLELDKKIIDSLPDDDKKKALKRMPILTINPGSSGNSPVQIDSKNGEITILVKSEDGSTPYKCHITAKGISFEYGSSKEKISCKYAPENGTAIDVTMSTSAFEDMVSPEKQWISHVAPVKSKAENSYGLMPAQIPGFMLGVYLNAKSATLSKTLSSKTHIATLLPSFQNGFKQMSMQVDDSTYHFVKDNDGQLFVYNGGRLTALTNNYYYRCQQNNGEISNVEIVVETKQGRHLSLPIHLSKTNGEMSNYETKALEKFSTFIGSQPQQSKQRGRKPTLTGKTKSSELKITLDRSETGDHKIIDSRVKSFSLTLLDAEAEENDSQPSDQGLQSQQVAISENEVETPQPEDIEEINGEEEFENYTAAVRKVFTQKLGKINALDLSERLDEEKEELQRRHAELIDESERLARDESLSTEEKYSVFNESIKDLIDALDDLFIQLSNEEYDQILTVTVDMGKELEEAGVPRDVLYGPEQLDEDVYENDEELLEPQPPIKDEDDYKVVATLGSERLEIISNHGDGYKVNEYNLLKVYNKLKEDIPKINSDTLSGDAAELLSMTKQYIDEIKQAIDNKDWNLAARLSNSCFNCLISLRSDANNHSYLHAYPREVYIVSNDLVETLKNTYGYPIDETKLGRTVSDESDGDLESRLDAFSIPSKGEEDSSTEDDSVPPISGEDDHYEDSGDEEGFAPISDADVPPESDDEHLSLDDLPEKLLDGELEGDAPPPSDEDAPLEDSEVESEEVHHASSPTFSGSNAKVVKKEVSQPKFDPKWGYLPMLGGMFLILMSMVLGPVGLAICASLGVALFASGGIYYSIADRLSNPYMKVKRYVALIDGTDKEASTEAEKFSEAEKSFEVALTECGIARDELSNDREIDKFLANLLLDYVFPGTEDMTPQQYRDSFLNAGLLNEDNLEMREGLIAELEQYYDSIEGKTPEQVTAMQDELLQKVFRGYDFTSPTFSPEFLANHDIEAAPIASDKLDELRKRVFGSDKQFNKDSLKALKLFNETQKAEIAKREEQAKTIEECSDITFDKIVYTTTTETQDGKTITTISGNDQVVKSNALAIARRLVYSNQNKDRLNKLIDSLGLEARQALIDAVARVQASAEKTTEVKQSTETQKANYTDFINYSNTVMNIENDTTLTSDFVTHSSIEDSARVHIAACSAERLRAQNKAFCPQPVLTSIQDLASRIKINANGEISASEGELTEDDVDSAFEIFKDLIRARDKHLQDFYSDEADFQTIRRFSPYSDTLRERVSREISALKKEIETLGSAAPSEKREQLNQLKSTSVEFLYGGSIEDERILDELGNRGTIIATKIAEIDAQITSLKEREEETERKRTEAKRSRESEISVFDVSGDDIVRYNEELSSIQKDLDALGKRKETLKAEKPLEGVKAFSSKRVENSIKLISMIPLTGDFEWDNAESDTTQTKAFLEELDRNLAAYSYEEQRQLRSFARLGGVSDLSRQKKILQFAEYCRANGSTRSTTGIVLDVMSGKFLDVLSREIEAKAEEAQNLTKDGKTISKQASSKEFSKKVKRYREIFIGRESVIGQLSPTQRQAIAGKKPKNLDEYKKAIDEVVAEAKVGEDTVDRRTSTGKTFKDACKTSDGKIIKDPKQMGKIQTEVSEIYTEEADRKKASTQRALGETETDYLLSDKGQKNKDKEYKSPIGTIRGFIARKREEKNEEYRQKVAQIRTKIEGYKTGKVFDGLSPDDKHKKLEEIKQELNQIIKNAVKDSDFKTRMGDVSEDFDEGEVTTKVFDDSRIADDIDYYEILDRIQQKLDETEAKKNQHKTNAKQTAALPTKFLRSKKKSPLFKVKGRAEITKDAIQGTIKVKNREDIEEEEIPLELGHEVARSSESED